MSPIVAGFIGIVAFLILLVLRMPIAVAMGLVGVIGFASVVLHKIFMF
jgi:hypothetical protein